MKDTLVNRRRAVGQFFVHCERPTKVAGHVPRLLLGIITRTRQLREGRSSEDKGFRRQVWLKTLRDHFA